MKEHHFVILEEPAEEQGAQEDLVRWDWIHSEFQILSVKHLRNFNEWRQDLIMTDLELGAQILLVSHHKHLCFTHRLGHCLCSSTVKVK